MVHTVCKMASLAFATSLMHCATIEVYQVSRQTIMEEEAQGEWPEFERQFAPRKPRQGAEFFPKEPNSKRKQRVFSVLNGEITNQK